MTCLLGRDLTAEEQAVRASLRKLLPRQGALRDAHPAVAELAANAPDAFFAAAMSLLESPDSPDARQHPWASLLESPALLFQLIRPERFSRQRLLEVCRWFLEIQPFLDVRLASLLPRRQEDANQLDTQTIVRLLDVLDEISPGPRLIPTLSPLARHPEPRVAAKASLLLARRVRNAEWVERHLASGDARVRANVVEALWSVNTSAARRTMWASLKDPNNRVAGTALIGLHLLGESSVDEIARRMLRDERSAFRWTAAWAMGKIGKPEFADCLRQALGDADLAVRRCARLALVSIRQATLAAQPPPSAPVPAPAPAPPTPPEVAAVRAPDEDLPPAPVPFTLRLDGSFVTAGG